MSVAYTDEIEIMTAIRDRLRAKHHEFTQKTCFLSDTPIPAVMAFSDVGVTICNGGSQYDEGTWMGAGPNAVATQTTILITVLRRCALDTPGKTEDALSHASKSILAYRKIILSALLTSDGDFCDGFRWQWVMMVDGNTVLIDGGPVPRGWSPPRYEIQGDHTYLVTTLTLTVGFDQSLAQEQ
jgi:hypothetical protein